MRALVVDQVGSIGVREVPYPHARPGQVTVKVQSSGLCGTDTHIFHGDFLSRYPVIPGHEFAGTVAEVGEGVEGWAEGDRVAVDPSVFCHECYFCKTDRGNHCLNWNGIGVTMPGGLAEYTAVPAANLYRLPDGVDFDEGAFIEPISCVVFGHRRLRPRSGDKALVFGAGPIGLLHVQLLARGGCSSVTVVDLETDRLELARQLGARYGVQAGPDQNRRLGEITEYGFDIVIDATGISKVAEGLIQHAIPTGKVMYFGVCPKDETIQVSPFEVYQKDLEIYGSFALQYTFYYSRDLLAEGVVQARPLISHHVGLDEATAIVADPGSVPHRMKVMVHPHGG